MNAITEQIMNLWQQAVSIWLSGGWAMWAIAAISLTMFWMGINVYQRLSGKGFSSVREKTWRHWINHPQERKGYIGNILDFVTGGQSLDDTRTYFEELRGTEIAPFERELKVMKICVSTAPLLGLLGTVTGMLATFSALASGSGGDKTMALVASGISEALITTETGLVIALPGVFAHYLLVRKLERYKAFLAHLETVCTQKQYKKLKIKMTSSTPVMRLSGKSVQSEVADLAEVA
ncbi:MAG: MotA/TolQ/ExbB proton channel family protein [Phycisphaerae bacterium]|nr:MotA/TolQ/ExbB proton channel family protein [Phycisphaerae bacterium]